MNIPDFIDFLPSFILTLISVFVLVRLIYSQNNNRKDFLFSFYLIAIIVFFLVYALKSSDLELGMALGMFAIFGILRYRTDTIPIKEMTYIFIMIGLSVLNALKGDESLLKLAIINLLVIFIALILEKIPHTKYNHSKLIIYDNVEMIKPDKRTELIADLESRLGHKIETIQIGDIDYLKETAEIKIVFE